MTNPIGTGIALALAGAFVALLIPESKAENQLFGNARRQLLDQAKDTAKAIQQKAVEAAKEAL